MSIYKYPGFDITNILPTGERQRPLAGFRATERFAQEFGNAPRTQEDVVTFLQQRGFTRSDPEYEFKDALKAIYSLTFGTIRQDGLVRSVSIKLEQLPESPEMFRLKTDYRIPFFDVIRG